MQQQSDCCFRYVKQTKTAIDSKSAFMQIFDQYIQWLRLKGNPVSHSNKCINLWRVRGKYDAYKIALYCQRNAYAIPQWQAKLWALSLPKTIKDTAVQMNVYCIRFASYMKLVTHLPILTIRKHPICTPNGGPPCAKKNTQKVSSSYRKDDKSHCQRI